MVTGNYTEGPLPLNALATSEITSSAKKTKNSICAIPEAAPAMPPNPKTAAIIAIIKNVIAQPNMAILLNVLIYLIAFTETIANLMPFVILLILNRIIFAS